MNAENIITETLQQIGKKNLGKALSTIGKLFAQRPSLMGATETDDIADDYRRMIAFMRQGSSDPDRRQLYQQLLQRLYTVASDLLVSWNCKNQPAWTEGFRVAAHLNKSHDFIQSVLETFVSDVAMLSLQPEEGRQQKSAELYSRHQRFMERLFATIWTSVQWTEADRKFYAGIITSPTIAFEDAALIVSAVMMGCMNRFDIGKLMTLADVWSRQVDDQLRERALVGWALALSDELSLYPDEMNELYQLTSSNDIERELFEMQMQAFYCMNAERDKKTIQNDIMPGIVDNSNLKMTRGGIVEKDDDPMRDILDPDADDKSMDAVEQGIKRMADMQKAGSDIYFGGFSAMKHFSFFFDMSNWFVPFYENHPGLDNIRQNFLTNNNVSIGRLLGNAPFCDSDKYSFALGLSMVINNLPKEVREMLSSDVIGFPGNESELQGKQFVRLMYLQNLYRFFRLYPMRGSLVEAFTGNDSDRAFFMLGRFFSRGKFDKLKNKLGMYLFKQKRFDELEMLLGSYQNNFTDDSKEAEEYALMQGYCLINDKKYDKAVDVFSQALVFMPDNEALLRGCGRAAMLGFNYAEARLSYGKLLEKHPDRKFFILNMSIALTETGDTAKAVELAYKLAYERPDDGDSAQLLGWALLNDGQAEKAYNAFRRVTTVYDYSPDFWINTGYCLWAQGNIEGAIKNLRKAKELFAADNKEKSGIDVLAEQFDFDRSLLYKYNITDVEMNIMLDIIGSES